MQVAMLLRQALVEGELDVDLAGGDTRDPRAERRQQALAGEAREHALFRSHRAIEAAA